jgi:glucosyl-dolichyl phosphate glucuronosyltransferase
MTPTISVVIATFNRSALLARCLRHLSRQAFQPGDEVVVSDNGSTDGTARVIEAARRHLPDRLRVVYEPRPGKSVAVSSALETCCADVLAFTDDDVLVGNEWLSRIRSAMRPPSVGLVGGPVLPIYAGRVPGWLDLEGEPRGFGRMAAPLALLDYGDAPERLGCRAALGANLAVRHDAFRAAGGYLASLGKLRGTLLSGEDHQLCDRVQRAGYETLYDPAIRVRHLVPRERLRFRYFLRWFFWSGASHAAMDLLRPAPRRGLRVLGTPGYVLRDFGTAVARLAGAALTASWPAAASQSTHAAFSAGYAWASWRSRSGQSLAAREHRREAA